MNGKQLYEALSVSPDQEGARNAALEFLEKTSTDLDGFKRIIDPVTGRWQQEFSANGQNYRIISPTEGISLRRYQKLRTAIEVVGKDMSLSDQLEQIAHAKKLLDEMAANKKGFVQLSVALENMSQSIARGARNWPLSAYAATLFIVRKGEDLKEYDEGIAEEKIKDWQAEGINATDFFFCCLLWEKLFNEKLNAFAVRLT